MKKIIHRLDMTTAEYIEQMKAGDRQRLDCQLLRKKNEPIPAGMECYHGNPLMLCDSFNCQGDSDRMKLGSPFKSPNAA